MKRLLILALICSPCLMAREMTAKEKMVVLPLQRTLSVKDYMEKSVREQELGYRDRLAFFMLKQACLPLSMAIKQISQASNETEDQSANLTLLYHGCSEGVLEMSQMYITQQ